jgi:undecaprenyl pyrophosphate synthase
VAKLKIPMVTLWWLSTENLTREAIDVTGVLDVIEDTIPEWVRGGLTARLGIRQPLTTSAALERRGRVRLKAGDH